MDLVSLFLLLALGTYVLKTRDERERMALLGAHLAPYQIEQHLQSLTEGYVRALGEADPQRQSQIWQLMNAMEGTLNQQFQGFAMAFAQVPAASARITRLDVPLPYARRILPGATFDMRALLQLHARGIAQAVQSGDAPKPRAHTVLAELLLMQHSCHWFCRSRPVASARLLVRHQTSYEQVLASVSPATRNAYRALVGV